MKKKILKGKIMWLKLNAINWAERRVLEADQERL